MIVEAEGGDFQALIAGQPPRGLALPEGEVAPLATLEMLSALAAKVRAAFAPAAWLLVEQGEVVGLCSIMGAPTPEGVIEIGYGVAPCRQNLGAAGRAVGDVVAWASSDARIAALTANTATANLFSQRTLERNGFRKVGARVDKEDGLLICWRIETGDPSAPAARR
jgi:RimJ/RimL family protein N-acetyltransferase